MKKAVLTKELFDCKCEYIKPLFDSCEYPWEMLSKIKEHIDNLTLEGIEGFSELKKGVLVGEGVEIAQTATIEPPAILGKGTKLRPGAYLRGNVITGSNCVIGNSTEIKNSILLDNVQVPHYNYVGDSVLGNYAHMGAGAICSNLKADKKEVVIRGESLHKTGIKKVGGILADGADVGCGCVLNPGTVIGKNTSVYPLVRLRGVYPEGAIVKDSNNVVERI
ncbi:MAG: UDP-N-acetylglucosamine pyrophosphorylase [Ruminococcaceae bacterium]|nr:UDP-N-acetylglucosamine pyrophosphorylase [Oscillospiraceae bacterium]